MNHPDVFLDSPIAILCEDWSKIREVVLQDFGDDVERLNQRIEEDETYLHRLRGIHSIVDANPAALQLLGVRDVAHLQSIVHMLLPADPTGQVVKAIVGGERRCEGERDLPSALGNRTPILWRSTLPEDPANFNRVYFFAVDVSRQKQAQAELDLARANLNHAGRLSLVGELVASMTHEVSQPISSIAILAGAMDKWLSHEPPRVEKAAALTRKVLANANHAGEVIARVRDFSRSAKHHLSEVDPTKLLSEAIALVEPESWRQGISVSVSAQTGLRPISVDPIQIKQVVVNLVINAIQATSGQVNGARERRIEVAVRETRDSCHFSIADTGPGFADLTAAVTPFFSTKREGLGLGLSICRRIVEDHGGVLDIESAPSGARVTFTVPFLAPHFSDGERTAG